MSIVLPFMVRHGEQQHITESYVSVPPALTITDEQNAIWTLGFREGAAPRGEFAFNVLRNGQETGLIASRIERRKGRIRVFTAQGWQWVREYRDAGHSIEVFTIVARRQPVSGEPIHVKILRDDRMGPPICAFELSSYGGWDGEGGPIPCVPGQWLCAIVSPVTDDQIIVLAELHDRRSREIPIVVDVTT